MPAERIRRLAAVDLGPGPWGQDGSPTWVGEVRLLEVERDRLVLSGPVEDQVAEAIALLGRCRRPRRRRPGTGADDAAR